MSFMMARGISSSGVLDAGGGIFSANTATLDGSNMHYGTAGSISVDATDSFTVAIWVQNSSTAQANIFRAHLGSWTMELNNGAIDRLVWCNSGNCQTISSVGLNDGNWHRVVGVFNQSTLRLHSYIDGVEVGASVSTTAFAFSGVVEIGRRENGTFRANASLSQPTVWIGTALSGTQITADYNGGISTCATDMLPTPTLAWDISTWTGSNDPTTDKFGALDLTAFNSPTYTDTGLTVECTS